MSIINAASILSVAPLVDFIIHPNVVDMSPLTKKILSLAEYLHYPVSLFSLFSVFFALVVMSTLVHIAINYSIYRTKYVVLRDLVIETYQQFFSAKWYFFSSSRMGDLLNTFFGEARVVGDAFGTMALFFANIIQVVLYLSVPLYISWEVTLVSILSAVLIALPFLLVGEKTYSLGKLNTSTANDLSAILQEGLGAAKVILGFGNQESLIRNVDRAFDAHRKVTVKSQTLSLAVPRLYQPCALFILIGAFFFSRKMQLPLSEISVLLYALVRIIPVVGNIAGQKVSLDNFFPSYEQIVAFRDKAIRLKQPSGNRNFDGFKKDLTIENLTFAYPNHEALFENLNIRIPKEKMVAIVGPSGAGKSTLIDIVMGFNEPSNGRVAIDGVSLKEFEIISYRKKIGYVPQEGILFNMSIKDNLLWAKEDATHEEIASACKQANAEEFILELPKAYDTVVGDRGVRLSGGQIQRIALARAILRRPSILILDEATSSLDTQSERLIQKAIEKIARITTMIIIAHRLSTIISADYIYVLSHGKVIEQGNYSELLNKKGYFYEMVNVQSFE